MAVKYAATVTLLKLFSSDEANFQLFKLLRNTDLVDVRQLVLVKFFLFQILRILPILTSTAASTKVIDRKLFGGSVARFIDCNFQLPICS